MEFSGEGNLTLPHLHWWGVGRSVARPGLREGRHATPLFSDHVSLHGAGLYRMHRQPTLQLVCVFDLRGPGKLNSSSHDAARSSRARGYSVDAWVDEAPGALSRARTAVTAARCATAPRRSACVAVVHFLFSSFLLLPLLPPSHQGEGGCCATGRAAVFRERVISIPCWPTCRRHNVPTKEKASRCHPTAREAPNVVVPARIVCCVGRPIKVFEGTKFDINSKWSLCASISPATAKLVSPPYHAGCRRTLPVDEEAPGIYV